MFSSYVRKLMSLTLRSCPLIAAEDEQLKGWNHALSFLGIVLRRALDLVIFISVIY
jgi:hypothetical protein